MAKRMGAVLLLASAFLVIGVYAQEISPYIRRTEKQHPRTVSPLPPLPPVDPFLSAARSVGFISELYPPPKPPRCIKLGDKSVRKPSVCSDSGTRNSSTSLK